MFERYTEKARRVIFFARYEASQFGSPYIETEHLLLGIIRDDKALTNRFLRSQVESIRKQVESHAVERQKASTSVDLPLSNESKRVLAYAAEEAERLTHKHIGTEHLLLGLLREEKCFAAQILMERDVRLDHVREELARQPHEAAQGQNQPSKFDALNPYVSELVEQTRPLVGREKELDRLIELLCRFGRTNAVLVGETGVGTHNPCVDVGKLNERRERRQAKPLTYDEEAGVKQFSPPWLSILITVLAETGLRVRKEALPLKWSDVDLESEPGCIRVRDSKTAAGVRPVWLTKHCRNTLIQWREFLGPGFSEYVFPSPRIPSTHITDYKKAWQKVAREAGIPDRRIYDLRASFASRANACHASGLTIAQLLGHAHNTQILPTYVKPLDENTKAVIEALDLARVRSGKSPSVQ